MGKALKINEVDGEQIVAMRLSGEPIRAIAKKFKLTVGDVNDALGRWIPTVLNHQTRTRIVVEDLELTDAMIKAFGPAARGGDAQAALVLSRFVQERRILLGLSLPTRADPMLIDMQAEPAQTSTDKLEAVIMRLCGEDRQPPGQKDN
jgi:hypothetical protein